MEISKLAIFLVNEHQSDQKNETCDFRINFSVCICSRKNNSVNGMPENVASRRILTKIEASIFHRI